MYYVFGFKQIKYQIVNQRTYESLDISDVWQVNTRNYNKDNKSKISNSKSLS